MADYEGYAYPDNFQNLNVSPSAMYPKGTHQHFPGGNTYHGVDIDTATIVSIASSCIILISGCIAVVCLIMYMKKTDMLYRSRTCAKCGAHVNRDESVRVPIHAESNQALDRPQVFQGTPFHPVIDAHQNTKNVGSIAIFRGFGELNPAKGIFSFENDPDDNEISADQLNVNLNTPGKSVTEFVKTSFMENHPDDYFDENEPTPYATFNLPGFDKDSKISDVCETFTAKFTEPPYMLLKKGIECPAPPQYADSVDYKMRLIEKENIYQSAGLSQCHSIASCSSNHEELIRAYEYGKQQKQKLLKLQDEFIEALNENDNDETCYRSLPSDRESPTDPGIREFTKSPPKPNEKRQGIVFHHQPTTAEMIEFSMQMTSSNAQGSEFILKQVGLNLNEQSNKVDLSPNETSHSFSSIQGSSSEAHTTSSNDSTNESTPSADSESGNGDDSSSTATPELPENKTNNFGAIPRDRSRNPSWASFTTMKSSSVLTSSQYPDSQSAFLSKSNAILKEGLSSDEDDFGATPKATVEVHGSNLLEEIYGSRLTSFGAAFGPSGPSMDQLDKRAMNSQLQLIEQSEVGSTHEKGDSSGGRTNVPQPAPLAGPQLNKSGAVHFGTSTQSQSKAASKRISSEIDC